MHVPSLNPVAGLETWTWNCPRWHPLLAHTIVHYDSNELEDARWFSRKEIEQGVTEDSLRLPSQYSIANRLITDWLSAGKE